MDKKKRFIYLPNVKCKGYIRYGKNMHGCYALKTQHRSHLVEMKRRMNQQVASKGYN